MDKQALAVFLADIRGSGARRSGNKKRNVSIWVDAEYKDRYDSIQERTGRQFNIKLQEIVKAAIDIMDPQP